MHLNQRIKAFAKLGDFLRQFVDPEPDFEVSAPLQYEDYTRFSELIKQAHYHNSWFTEEQVKNALSGWSINLTQNSLEEWVKNYPEIPLNTTVQKIAVVMAGNLPLVGFHDFLSVLIAGHKIIAKPSSNDDQLLPYLAKILIKIEPDLKDFITFTNEKLPPFDAVIATGSNNTSRYFEYYFKDKPHIIRKNRNAVAILTARETKDQLAGLAEDIFTFYGMGCRSVSKIFVPQGYDFDLLFNAVYRFRESINHAKYANNYDYNKAVYLMSVMPVLDNGFMVLKEDEAFSSPIAVVFYSYYNDEKSLKEYLQQNRESIQCIVANGFAPNEIPFGTAQKPKLDDYADGIDTLAFLAKL